MALVTSHDTQLSETISFTTAENLSAREFGFFISIVDKLYAACSLFQAASQTDEIDHEVYKGAIQDSAKRLNSYGLTHTTGIKILFHSIRLEFIPLSVHKVSINSPGYLELLGSLNPLNFLKELIQVYLDYKIKKQNLQLTEFKLVLEGREKELKILTKQVELMKQMGYSDEEIKDTFQNMLFRPLWLITNHKEIKIDQK